MIERAALEILILPYLTPASVIPFTKEAQPEARQYENLRLERPSTAYASYSTILHIHSNYYGPDLWI